MTVAVEFIGLTKSFAGVLANQDLSFQVKKGSIHAIVGENGAGKSTAMKLLYGVFQPDSGEIKIDQKTWGIKGTPWGSPLDAIQSGIGMVHQHFMLAGPYTVLENILLGVETARSGYSFLPSFLRPIDRQGARHRLKQLSVKFGLDVNLDARVEDLSVGVQQKIEILKLLYRNANILILDEPTAVLTPQETVELFKQMKLLSQLGKTILLITHKLKEVMAMSDRVTILRRGKVVGERETVKTRIEELASLMVGRDVVLQMNVLPSQCLGTPVLDIKNLTLNTGHARVLKDLSFQVRRGEIVGIAGVEGNGQLELIEALLHAKDYGRHLIGDIQIMGQDIRLYSTRAIKELGVGVIPNDRLRDGLLLERPVRENFLLGLQRRMPFQKVCFVSDSELDQSVYHAMEGYDIRPRLPKIKVGVLSGGNQQKLVIARELQSAPSFIIAAQPTRGVDIGAIEFIQKRIVQARDTGCGILLISSELDEVMALSDRILVMFSGAIVAEFKRGEVSEKEIGLHMGGAVC
jgi:simple sugar transport system ATP-binding protein